MRINPALPATDETCNNVTLLPSILPPRANSGNASADERPSVQHDGAGIDLPANLAGYNKLEIVTAPAPYSVEILRPEFRAPRRQDARRWNQGPENLMDESCLDFEIHFTTILEKICRCSYFTQAANPRLSKGKAPT